MFAFLVFVIVAPYSCSSIYDFPESKPFTGNQLYNPYEQNSGSWLKSNFHAHSKAWVGFSDGDLSPMQVDSIYNSFGYAIRPISNYMHVTPPFHKDSFYLPLIERGYSVFKRHQGMIGVREVVWLDFFLYQNIHHKQHILKLVDAKTDFTVLHHPEFMRGYEPEDFKYLTDYDFIEVLNHYRTSEHHWDTTLSAGRAVFGIGSDDSHDQRKPDETARFWTMIKSNEREKTQIYNAMRSGNMYMVRGHRGFNDVELKEVKTLNDTLLIVFTGKVKEFKFIGQGGKTLAKVTENDSAMYVFNQGDTYVRTEVKSDSCDIFLQPIFRHSGEPFPVYSATVNYPATWAYRISFIMFFIVFFYALLAYFVVIQKRNKFGRFNSPD